MDNFEKFDKNFLAENARVFEYYGFILVLKLGDYLM